MILFLFNADVNWPPGSASPYGYSRQPVLQLLLLIYIYIFFFFFLLSILFLSKSDYKKKDILYIRHLCPEMHLTLNLGTSYKTGLFVVFI